jgi:hypothetical protein
MSRPSVVLPVCIVLVTALSAQRTVKPVLHARHWLAITGKPLAATAGAMIFQKGGNPVDAACAMIGATCTMFDTLGWGSETQALIYNPKSKKAVGINALGVAPTCATPEFFRSRKMKYPPDYGLLAAVSGEILDRFRHPCFSAFQGSSIQPQDTAGRRQQMGLWLSRTCLLWMNSLMTPGTRRAAVRGLA